MCLEFMVVQSGRWCYLLIGTLSHTHGAARRMEIARASGVDLHFQVLEESRNLKYAERK